MSVCLTRGTTLEIFILHIIKIDWQLNDSLLLSTMPSPSKSTIYLMTQTSQLCVHWFPDIGGNLLGACRSPSHYSRLWTLGVGENECIYPKQLCWGFKRSPAMLYASKDSKSYHLLKVCPLFWLYKSLVIFRAMSSIDWFCNNCIFFQRNKNNTIINRISFHTHVIHVSTNISSTDL